MIKNIKGVLVYFHNVFRRNRKIKKLSIISVTLFVCICFLTNKYIQPVRFIFVHQNINGSCNLPEIDPFDESVMKYIWHPKPIECDPTPSMVYIDGTGMLSLNNSIIQRYNQKDLECFYQIVKRSDNNDNDIVLLPKIKFKNPVYIAADTVNVKCELRGNLLYDGVLYNVDTYSVLKSKHIAKTTNENPNVLIFGLDSVSRLAAERKLTKTMEFIKHRLNGYIFKGYTSVAATTYPNVLVTLTGKPAYSNELPKIDPRTEFTDSYPFIWKNFSEKGYVTMYGEDFPDISMFNYMLKGFKNPPVDHYMRPYYIARQVVHPVQSNLDQVFMFLEDKNINFKKYSSLCYKEKPKHVIHIENYQKFVTSYKYYRKFAFSWLTEIGHDYMNFLELADNDIVQMLQSFHKNGYLNSSVFIFFSDHGPRTDEIRNTAVGRIEERMPLLSIVLPEHIKQKHPNLERTLRENENRLTTPFDLYETFVDILNSNFKAYDKLFYRPYPRGISLFRNLPKDRTCSDAHIAEHFCACYTARNVSVKDPVITAVSSFVVRSINDKLVKHPQCSILELIETKEAQRIETGLRNVVESNRKTLLNLFYQPEIDKESRYLVLVETKPGNALFEATVSVVKGNYKLLGDVSRTNRYNNQSHCVSFRRLKPLCFCKDILFK